MAYNSRRIKEGNSVKCSRKADGLEKTAMGIMSSGPSQAFQQSFRTEPAQAISSAGAAIASWFLTHLVLMLLLLHTNVGFWSPYYHTKGEVGIEAHSSTQQWAEAS